MTPEEKVPEALQAEIDKIGNVQLQAELEFLVKMQQRAADTLRHGSFSERRPDLGKMHTCAYCGARRLEGTLYEDPCCHIGFTVLVPMFSAKKMMKKFVQHKRHGQGFAFHVRQTTKQFQSDPERLKAAVRRFYGRHAYQLQGEPGAQWYQLRLPAPENIPSFAEQYVRKFMNLGRGETQ